MPTLTIGLMLLLAGVTTGLPVFTEDYWIILTGSKDQKETEHLLAEVMTKWPAAVELSAGYPTIHSSDNKTGFNPGYIIAIAGECSTKADAVAVQDELRKSIPGVYIRKVARYLPGFVPNCPRLKIKPTGAKKTKPPKGYTLQEEGAVGRNGLVWRIYVAQRECGQSVIVRLLGADGSLVEERKEEAHCVRGDPEEPGSGESRIWSATIDSDDGGVTRYVLLTYEMWAYDTGCNGGEALCPSATGMSVEKLEGMCTSSAYRKADDEKHCGN